MANFELETRNLLEVETNLVLVFFLCGFNFAGGDGNYLLVFNV